MHATVQHIASSAHPVPGSGKRAANDTGSQKRKETEKKETLARQVVVSTEEKQRGENFSIFYILGGTEGSTQHVE